MYIESCKNVMVEWPNYSIPRTLFMAKFSTDLYNIYKIQYTKHEGLYKILKVRNAY